MNEQELLNAVCFKLIKTCRETNADEMTIKQENVTFQGEPLGDWEIIVRKAKEK